jgi:hypothetical protein
MVMKKGRAELPVMVKMAVVASVLLLGLTPLASATITSFTITPDTCWGCDVITTYTVEVKSDTLWHWQNTTIPAGFHVIEPTTGGVEIVRTDFWDDNGYVGYVCITANPSDPSGKVDVTAQIGSDTATTTQAISYEPGATFTINSPWGGAQMLVVRWPTATGEGYANVSVPGLPLLNITDVYTLSLCCPSVGERSYFHATAEGDPVGQFDPVICSVPAPAYNTFGSVALVGILSVVLGLATMKRRRYS